MALTHPDGSDQEPRKPEKVYAYAPHGLLLYEPPIPDPPEPHETGCHRQKRRFQDVTLESNFTSLLNIRIIQPVSSMVQSIGNHKPYLSQSMSYSWSASARITQSMEDEATPIANSADHDKPRRWFTMPVDTNLEGWGRENHNNRKQELLAHLEHILPPDGSSGCTILLCWGKMNRCKIIPIHVPVVANEREHLEAIVSEGLPDDEVYGVCEYDSRSGQYYHVHGCLIDEQAFPYHNCPVVDFNVAKRRLNDLPWRATLLDAFLEPAFAAESDFIERKLVMVQRSILEKLDELYCPGLHELEFYGLLVNEGWEFDSQHIILPLAATLLLVLVVLSQTIYGDWSTTWTFGGFVVSFVTLIWMWARYAVD
ncbi:hypothetical protein F5Y13DRAFT_185914 [Hypoxylon sp. FL1857]|nr:hypothetical protein F5Y13DRAFT_185914 [Hypoxylon sp. FL1857]